MQPVDSATMLDSSFYRKFLGLFVFANIANSSGKAQLTISHTDDDEEFFLSTRSKKLCNLNEILKNIVAEKTLEFESINDLKINLNLTPNPTYLLSCECELMRIMSNLINNSVEAKTNRPMVIDISLRNTPNMIKIKIIDNGKGIPSHVMNKIGIQGFSYGKIKGNGLGVSHAKEFVESSGGFFKIISTENSGTEILIDLPIIKYPN